MKEKTDIYHGLTNWVQEYKKADEYEELTLLIKDYINNALMVACDKRPDVNIYELAQDWEDYIDGRIFYSNIPYSQLSELSKLIDLNIRSSDYLSELFNTYFPGNFTTLNEHSFLHFNAYFRTLLEQLFSNSLEDFIDCSMGIENINFAKNFIINGLIYKFCSIQIEMMAGNDSSNINLSLSKKESSTKRKDIYCKKENINAQLKILTRCIGASSLNELKCNVLLDFILKNRNCSMKDDGLTKSNFKHFCYAENINLFSKNDVKLIFNWLKKNVSKYTTPIDLLTAIKNEVLLTTQPKSSKNTSSSITLVSQSIFNKSHIENSEGHLPKNLLEELAQAIHRDPEESTESSHTM